VFLHSLFVSGFRNLAEQRIELEKRITSITGRNGQGKTSLVEAVYLLVHPKSFRTSKHRELIAWEKASTGARVEAQITTQNGNQTLAVEITPRGRTVTLNGKKLESVLGFYGQVKAVIFTPDELLLVKGPPQQRRSFLDRTLAMVDSPFVENAVHYQRALKNRNALLMARDGRGPSLNELAFWDQLLIRHGRALTERRSAFVSFLSDHVASAYQRLVALEPGAASEKVALYFESDFVNESGKVRSDEELTLLLREASERDIRRKTTTFGVHRDELKLTLDTGAGEHEARATASQGQARTLALAMKLAALDFLRTQTSDDPILLLDDVESELDQARKSALYQLLASSKNQVLLTGTQPFSGLDNLGGEIDFLSIESGIAKRP